MIVIASFRLNLENEHIGVDTALREYSIPGKLQKVQTGGAPTIIAHARGKMAEKMQGNNSSKAKDQLQVAT